MSFSSNWDFVNNRQFSRILLASTHDSTSYTVQHYKHSSILVTQTLTIQEQLKVGIRSFDVKVNFVHNVFYTHAMKLKYFMIQISTFLHTNPQEMVEIRLKYGNDVDINKLWTFVNHPALHCSQYIMHKNQPEQSIRTQVFINRRLLIWSDGNVGTSQFYDGSTWFRNNIHTNDHVCKIININLSLKNPIDQYYAIEYTLSPRKVSKKCFINIFACKSSDPRVNSRYDTLRKLNSKLPDITTMKFDYSKAHVVALDFVESNTLSEFCMQYNKSNLIK